eukprot:2509114-Rhodomonas_salina.1
MSISFLWQVAPRRASPSLQPCMSSSVNFIDEHPGKIDGKGGFTLGKLTGRGSQCNRFQVVRAGVQWGADAGGSAGRAPASRLHHQGGAPLPPQQRLARGEARRRRRRQRKRGKEGGDR